ncbi:hypothetical protein [Pseudomonas citronellolis]|uniref:hypothetical protein n=1 Tax=Pseudomonas citronellolis TaxID=53408 RepID=UPI002D78EA3E|nr:hypothetical protein [Pseudomonas citronellolis]WRT83933.1 hypothetical protein VK748_05795 [Pseudomonas citronellolis]
MPTLYVIAILFFVTPAILGHCARSAESLGFFTSDGKLDVRVKTSEAALSVTILCSIYFFFALAGYKAVAGQASIALLITDVSLLIISSIALSALVFRAFWIYQKASFLINLVITILTLWITWFAGSIAIGYVSQTTNLSASEFPSAVGGLTLLYAPVLWGLIMSLVSLPLYLISGAVIVSKSGKKEKGVAHSYSSLIWMSLFFGLAFSFTVSVNVFSRLSTTTLFKNFETWILVTSGYPLSKHTCVEKKSPEDSFVILSTGEIGTAIYDGKSYTYGKVKCPPD